jgi:hypothetical protein
MASRLRYPSAMGADDALRLAASRRCGKADMMRRRSSRPSRAHTAISASVRPHPAQRPECGSIVQTLTQGDSTISAMALARQIGGQDKHHGEERNQRPEDVGGGVGHGGRG